MSRFPSEPQRLSRRRTLAVLGGVGLAVGAGFTTRPRTHRLVCRDQRTDDVLGRWPVPVGSVVSLSWIHSIELTPWTDFFVVEPDRFRLIRTEFQAYGAGTPEGDGTPVRREGDVFVMELDRPVETINWIHSRRQHHTLSVGDRVLAPSDSLPHHRPLELSST